MPDTLRRNQAEIDEFDLHDLAALAPVQPNGSHQLDALAPDWELRRDELLPPSPQSPAPRRSPWTGRLAVAAAAAVLVGAGAWGVSRPHTGMPAAPSSSAPASRYVDGARPIAPGHYLQRRMTEVDLQSPTTGVPARQRSTRSEAVDAGGRYWVWYDGQAQVSGQQWTWVDLSRVPSDPHELYGWLAAGKGSTATPAPATPSAGASAAPVQNTVWENLAAVLDDPRSTRQVRQALVEVAAMTADTTVARNSTGTVLTHTVRATGITIVDTLVLDAATYDLRRSTRNRTERDGSAGTTHHLVIERTFDPVRDVTGTPKP